jgi:hypothetical protein
MSQTHNSQEKESKLWLVGMVGIIIAITIFTFTAIFVQHQQLSAETTTTASEY